MERAPTTQEDEVAMVMEEVPRPRIGRFFLGKSAFSVYEAMATHLLQHGLWESSSRVDPCDLVLGDRHGIRYATLRCSALAQDGSFFRGSQRWVNYFQGSEKLTRKSSMARQLAANDTTSSKWLPESYVVSPAPSTTETTNNMDAEASSSMEEKKKPAKRSVFRPRPADDDRATLISRFTSLPHSTWIAKPNVGSKGQDIQLLRGPDELHDFLARLDAKSLKQTASYLIQRYVERPLLLSHQRKFDVRVWAMLQSPYDVWVFSQGSCRTSSVPYDLTHTNDNLLAHLTNHCLQEASGVAGYGRYEAGNEMWFYELRTYLVEVLHAAPDVLEKVILPQMANIITRTLLMMRPLWEVLDDEPFRCFQLFGYDFLIDEEFNVFLLEVNGSPGIATRYLQPVVEGMCRCIGCDGGTYREELFSGAAPRKTWGIEEEAFVLLWSSTMGDPVPEGLVGL